MTSAHKPTFHPTIASANPGGYRFLSPYAQLGARDLASETRIKYRPGVSLLHSSVSSVSQSNTGKYMPGSFGMQGQGEKEREQTREKTKGPIVAMSVNRKEKEFTRTEEKERLEVREKERADRNRREAVRTGMTEEEKTTNNEGSMVQAIEYVPENEFDDRDASDVEDGRESADSESDEEAELARELDRIRAEKEADRRKIEAEEAEKEARERADAILKGNPLVNLSMPADTTLKRRWDDDIVFRNQARDEPELKKRFINDTVRSDFHRKVCLYSNAMLT